MVRTHINRLAVAGPEQEVHDMFVRFAARLLRNRGARFRFERMAACSQISQRRSSLSAAGDRGCALAFGPGLVAEAMLFGAAA